MKRSPPRPLSIKLIAIWYLLGVFGPIFSSQHGACFLGFYISGWIGHFLNLLMAPLEIYLGIGLWRLNETTRRVAICFESYTVLTLLLAAIIPSSRNVFMAKVIEMGFLKSQGMPFLLVTCVGGAFSHAIIIYILMQSKRSFTKASPSEDH